MEEEAAKSKLDLLCKRRSTLKGGITRNRNKAQTVIEVSGSRQVLKNIRERIQASMNEILQVNGEIIALLDTEGKKIDAEDWLNEVRLCVEECIDEIDAHVELRADESKTSLSYRPSRAHLFGLKRQSSVEGREALFSSLKILVVKPPAPGGMNLIS